MTLKWDDVSKFHPSQTLLLIALKGISIMTEKVTPKFQSDQSFHFSSAVDIWNLLRFFLQPKVSFGRHNRRFGFGRVNNRRFCRKSCRRYLRSITTWHPPFLMSHQGQIWCQWVDLGEQLALVDIRYIRTMPHPAIKLIKVCKWLKKSTFCKNSDSWQEN